MYQNKIFVHDTQVQNVFVLFKKSLNHQNRLKIDFPDAFFAFLAIFGSFFFPFFSPIFTEYRH